ncbi:MAG: hypothetical protein PWP24_1656 [Clostridiales bacterium]|nr:hypothetical protein [Clostridiales bacterium]
MKIKKFAKVVMLSLALTMTAQSVTLPYTVSYVEAAKKVGLNVSKSTIEVGDSFNLKVTGTSKKATYKSSKSKVASVTKAGKVTGKAKGNAVITVTVDKKKYKCKVTVKEANNEAVEKAPFKAVEVKVGDIGIVAPKAWNQSVMEYNGANIASFSPKEVDAEKGSSYITVTAVKKDYDNKDFDLYKETIIDPITEDALKKQLLSKLGYEVKVEDYAITVQEESYGKVSLISYTAKKDSDFLFSQKIYDIFANGYLIEISVVDNGVEAEPAISDITDYMLKTVAFK